MSKSFRLAIFVAILVLVGMQYTESGSSPSRVEGRAKSEPQANFVGAVLDQTLRAPVHKIIGGTAALAPAEGVFASGISSIHASTDNTISLKLSDIPVGKAIQVGELKFVKVGSDQYVSIVPVCADPVLTKTGAQKLLTYTGNYQSYTFYAWCDYQIELWGAQGGCYESGYTCGKAGAYTSGKISIANNKTAYIYVGQGLAQVNGTGFNAALGSTGGGNPGGGATDVRLISGNWYDKLSLNSRIMVAAGGGGVRQSYVDLSLGYAGGLIGYSATSSKKPGGTQTGPGNVIDYGCTGTYTTSLFGIAASCGATSGGGYYAGSGGAHATGGGAGGSSYISGHTGCVAIAEGSTSEPRAVRKSGCTTGTTDPECSYHYSGLIFKNTVMIDGLGYQWTNTKGALKQMPNPNGGNYASGVGHTGNGYARITRLN